MNKIVYHNFAPGAAENAAFSSESSKFDYTVSLTEDSEPVNFASLEHTGINLLDGNLCLAESTDNLGFVSSDISGADRLFPNGGIRLVFSFSGVNCSGPGITLHFMQNICPKIKAEFFHDDELLISETFRPSSLDFYCDIPAEMYNKAVITFIESEIPYQFVKLKNIDFGRIDEINEFFGAINIYEEISVDCSDLPYDTCDFDAVIPENITPQTGQSFFVYHGSDCFGKFTTEKLTDENRFGTFSVKASDDKMVLGKSPFSALAAGTHTADEIISAIFSHSFIRIDNGGFGNTELNGFIKSGHNSRYAAAMLCMGGGFFLSSARNKKLCLLKLRDRRNEIISADRILGQPEYTKNAPYTQINLYEHKGSEFNNDTAAVHTANNESVTANIAVRELKLDKFSLFSDPAARLEEIKAIGFERNEIRAKIIMSDTDIRTGDIRSIETAHGIKTGIVKSLDISIQGSEITAEAVIIETEVI